MVANFREAVTDLEMCSSVCPGVRNIHSQSHSLSSENNAKCKLFNLNNKIQCCLLDSRLTFLKEEIDS